MKSDVWMGLIAPAPLALSTKTVDQRLIAVCLGTSALVAIPMSPLLSIAFPVSDAEVAQIVCATEAAGLYMLDVSALPCAGIKAQWPATDKTLADPISPLEREGSVGLGDAIH